MSQILWCFLRGWRGIYKCPLTSRDFICNDKKNGTDKYDVPVRRAFRWASEQKFCEAELHEIFRIPAPWLTKEIIFVCTVFLSFTLWMPCERTLIHAQFTLWTAPQNLPIYVMELLVIRWTPMREWQKSIYILKVN